MGVQLDVDARAWTWRPLPGHQMKNSSPAEIFVVDVQARRNRRQQSILPGGGEALAKGMRSHRIPYGNPPGVVERQGSLAISGQTSRARRPFQSR